MAKYSLPDGRGMFTFALEETINHENMKHFKTYLGAMALALSGCQSATDSCETTELWYAQPAEVWMESLPIGNGRLGAMTYGGIEEEKLALNESTMWSGQYNENQNIPFGREKMNQLRKLFFEGKLSEGNRIAGDNLHGNQTSFGTHLPIGDLKMQFIYPEGKVTGYRRSLSLDEAVSSVSFNSGGVNYKREYFATNPDNVLVLRLTADKQKSITMNMGLDLMRQADLSVEDNQLVFTGKVDFPLHGPGGVCFEGRIAVLADNGEVKMEQSEVGIKEADAVTLIVDVRTDYKSPDYKTLCADGVKKAAAKSYDELKQAHIKDYNTLYNRVSIHFGQDANRALPTDVRWKQVKEGKTDTGLDALFFQYGRYLTIASSRENSPLPIALQGFSMTTRRATWAGPMTIIWISILNRIIGQPMLAILPNVMPPCLPILRIWRITVRRLPKWSMDVKAGLLTQQPMSGDILLPPVPLFGDCSRWQAHG